MLSGVHREEGNLRKNNATGNQFPQHIIRQIIYH